MAEAGVPAGKVRPLSEALEMPQVAAREVFLTVEDPATGKPVQIPNAGFTFRRDGPGVTTAAPKLGEHGDEILSALRARHKTEV